MPLDLRIAFWLPKVVGTQCPLEFQSHYFALQLRCRTGWGGEMPSAVRAGEVGSGSGAID